jgi:hypothetical protein
LWCVVVKIISRSKVWIWVPKYFSLNVVWYVVFCSTGNGDDLSRIGGVKRSL